MRSDPSSSTRGLFPASRARTPDRQISPSASHRCKHQEEEEDDTEPALNIRPKDCISARILEAVVIYPAQVWAVKSGLWPPAAALH